jgi:predicted RNase H-like nuclease (RuvC/YqgF family)
MNTIEFEGKTIIVDGKGDEQFVNDRIRELREKRDKLQNKIFELSKQLNQLEEERNNTQEEIDEEFLRQEHAYDLVGKYIQRTDEIYFVTGVERVFNGVKILSNWYCNPKDKLFYTSSGKGKPIKIISFENLNAILSGKDENVKFISRENALEIMNQVIKMNQIIKENNKTYCSQC